MVEETSAPAGGPALGQGLADLRQTWEHLARELAPGVPELPGIIEQELAGLTSSQLNEETLTKVAEGLAARVAAAGFPSEATALYRRMGRALYELLLLMATQAELRDLGMDVPESAGLPSLPEAPAVATPVPDSRGPGGPTQSAAPEPTRITAPVAATKPRDPVRPGSNGSGTLPVAEFSAQLGVGAPVPWPLAEPGPAPAVAGPAAGSKPAGAPKAEPTQGAPDTASVPSPSPAPGPAAGVAPPGPTRRPAAAAPPPGDLSAGSAAPPLPQRPVPLGGGTGGARPLAPVRMPSAPTRPAAPARPATPSPTSSTPAVRPAAAGPALAASAAPAGGALRAPRAATAAPAAPPAPVRTRPTPAPAPPPSPGSPPLQAGAVKSPHQVASAAPGPAPTPGALWGFDPATRDPEPEPAPELVPEPHPVAEAAVAKAPPAAESDHWAAPPSRSGWTVRMSPRTATERQKKLQAREAQLPPLIDEILATAKSQQEALPTKGKARKVLAAARERLPVAEEGEPSQRIHTLLESGELDEAATMAVQFAESAPGEMSALIACAVGDAAQQAKQPELAVLCFTSAVLSDPPCERASWQLCNLSVERRDATLGPVWLEYIARLLRARGADGDSIAVYRQLLNLAPRRRDIRELLRTSSLTGILPD